MRRFLATTAPLALVLLAASVVQAGPPEGERDRRPIGRPGAGQPPCREAGPEAGLAGPGVGQGFGRRPRGPGGMGGRRGHARGHGRGPAHGHGPGAGLFRDEAVRETFQTSRQATAVVRDDLHAGLVALRLAARQEVLLQQEAAGPRVMDPASREAAREAAREAHRAKARALRAASLRAVEPEAKAFLARLTPEQRAAISRDGAIPEDRLTKRISRALLHSGRPHGHGMGHGMGRGMGHRRGPPQGVGPRDGMPPPDGMRRGPRGR